MKTIYALDLSEKDVSRAKNEKRKSDYYMCLNVMDYSDGEVLEWDIYHEKQNGYKTAKEKYPWVYETVCYKCGQEIRDEK